MITIFFLLALAGFPINAAEAVFATETPVISTQNLDQNHYIVLEQNGTITAYNNLHKPVSIIKGNSFSLMKILDNSKLAAVNGNRIFIYKDLTKTPRIEKVIETTLKICAITYAGKYMYIGANGEVYRMKTEETTPQPIPGSFISPITALDVKNDVLAIVSAEGLPRLINLQSMFMEATLLPPKESQNTFAPTITIAFRPGPSMDLLIAQEDNVYIYDASASDNAPVKRVPKAKYNMAAPILSAGYSQDGRFIVSAQQDKSVIFIDTERTDNRGQNIVSTRTGFSTTVATFCAHAGIGVLLGAGRNVYLESTGSGRMILRCGTTLTSTRYFTFSLENTENNTVEKRSFSFGYYQKENAWDIPEGNYKITAEDSSVIIKNENVTIESAPINIDIRILEPETPEKPRPIVIRPPPLPLLPPVELVYTSGYLISQHKDRLLFTDKHNLKTITIPDSPYTIKADSGKILTVSPGKLTIYTCTKGEPIETIPVSITAKHIAYKNNVITIAADNTAFIFAKGKLSTQILQESEITCLELSQDGKLLMIATNRFIRSFETDTGNEIPLHTLPGKATIKFAAFSGPAPEYPSARYFALWSSDGEIKLCDGIGGQEIKAFRVGEIASLKFDGNDKIVFHDTANNAIRYLNLNSSTTVYETFIEGSVFAILPDESVAYADKVGLIIINKRRNDIAKIGLTEDKGAWFTVRDSTVPELFQAADNIAAMFTDVTGRLLTPEEIDRYRTAQLPLPLE